MSIELRVKYLQYLLNKNGDRGFTSLEVLIVIFLLLICAASALIILPSFLHTGNKAPQSEAKQYVHSMNKAQHAYYAENGKFVTKNDAAAWNSLGIGIKTQTTNYKYSIGGNDKAVFSYGVAREDASKPLRSYVGGVFLVPDGAIIDDRKTVAVICETKSPTTAQPAEPILQDDVITCGENTTPLNHQQDLVFASNYTQAMNQAQQNHYSKNGTFANSLKALGFKIKTETENYQYSVSTTAKGAFHHATSKQPDYYSYVGAIFVIPNAAKNLTKKTISIFCEANYPGNKKAANPIYQNGVLACGAGTKQINAYGYGVSEDINEYIKVINEAQQAYYSKQRIFADSIEKLGTGITETDFHKYSTNRSATAAFSYATPKGTDTGYVTGVFAVPNNVANPTKTVVILCQYYSGDTLQKPANPTYNNGVLRCGANTNQVYDYEENIKYVEAINEAQQDYYSQKRIFADSIQKLGTGVTQTNLHKYSVKRSSTAVFSYAIPIEPYGNTYVGGVFAVPGGTRTKAKTVAILCEKYLYERKIPANPTYKNGVLACAADTREVSRTAR
ncbi:hypothetical protein H6S82_07920 [Planktothrix sp. FACHB-1355]|uniref:Prepilin-type N-terminal cleavage/methylation domain-containing protein n=1 Tax=Aerosakkonema funiforme FACHB-1375 TaxID=2949571 RepID=A0A926ZFS8_9CYAN|nr:MULTISPECIES: type IV pilin-like G/H family protein [Oscillatoriales]MBD2181448.1 hypothetical protein [Aerosakkonema funiforme FACHB-1375]MBD3558782.1 hypothetical protein [Planktothrix sp. FACHB-1355]